MCPGRFIARQEVLAFVAFVLKRFDLKLVSKGKGKLQQDFPRLEELKPTLGVIGPVQGEDVVVEISQQA